MLCVKEINDTELNYLGNALFKKDSTCSTTRKTCARSTSK
jgi:hypothetical protein